MPPLRLNHYQDLGPSRLDDLGSFHEFVAWRFGSVQDTVSGETPPELTLAGEFAHEGKSQRSKGKGASAPVQTGCAADISATRSAVSESPSWG